MRFFYAFIGFLWGAIAGVGIAVGLYAIVAGITWLMYAGKAMSESQATTAMWILLIALAIAAVLLFVAMGIGVRRGYRYGASVKGKIQVRILVLHLMIPVLLSLLISILPAFFTPKA